jgi:hypothetical protein
MIFHIASIGNNSVVGGRRRYVHRARAHVALERLWHLLNVVGRNDMRHIVGLATPPHEHEYTNHNAMIDRKKDDYCCCCCCCCVVGSFLSVCYQMQQMGMTMAATRIGIESPPTFDDTIAMHNRYFTTTGGKR